jgi:glycosyltransferase involved in cell wall biosynthesis
MSPGARPDRPLPGARPDRPLPGARPDRPRILAFASSADAYGADRMLRESVAALAPDHEVTVVLPEDGPLRVELTRLGATCHVVADYTMRRRYRSVPGIARLAAANVRVLGLVMGQHRRRPFDLVLTNTMAVVAGAAAAVLLRRPHLWHVHEILTEPRWLARSLAAAVAHAPGRVITCSDAALAHLVTDEPALASRARAVGNAVPLPVSPADPRGDGRVHIGCIGRLHPGKGHAELLDAFARARAAHPEGGRWQLHTFGDVYPGNEALRAALHERAAAPDLRGAVVFHGFEADIDRLYRSLHLVVVPSTTAESFSLVCAEAQSYGLPVIAPAHGGPAEVVTAGETGLLVDTGDPDALASALAALAGDPDERERMGRTGRRRATRAFALDRYHRELRAAVAETRAHTRAPWTLRAALWFGIRNRRRKARVIRSYLRGAGVETVVLVGSGGASLPHELIVERAIASEVTIAGVVDLWPSTTTGWPYIRADGRALPLRDQSVDLVLSQAVVEHVGDHADQHRLLDEQRRVGRRWLVTTPNRWFPVEPHTGAILRHWSAAWRAGRPEFTRLLSRAELHALTPDATMRRGRWFSPTFLAAGPGRARPRRPAVGDARATPTATTGRAPARTEAVPNEASVR